MRNFFALASGEALSRVFAFGATIYLARLLGADGYGIIAFALAINLYFIKIAEFALEWVGTEEIAKTSPDPIPKLTSAILSARLIITFVLMFVAAIAIWLILPDPERFILLLYLLVLVPTAINTKWVYIGMEDSRPVGLSRIAGEALALAIILSLVHSKGDLWVAPVAQASGEICVAFMLIIILWKRSFKLSFYWDLSIVTPVLKKAFPLVSHMLVGLFIYNSDLIFLRYFHTNESVGLYSVAYVLISFITNLGITYGMSLMPAFARLEKGSTEERSFYQTILAQVFTVSIPIAVGGYFLAENIINFAFGEGYNGSVLALQIIIWSVPFTIIRYVPWVALISRNKQNLLFKVIFYAAIFNIILNLLLIPEYGIVGAAIATIFTEIFTSVLMFDFASNNGLPFACYRRFLKPVSAVLVMAFVLFLGNHINLFFSITLGALTYIFALFALGGIQYRKGSLPSLKV